MNKNYFISNYDNMIHNIYDVDHQVFSPCDKAYIGKHTDEGFRVDDEVTLYTLQEIVKFFE
jgi:hypothetical protein